MPLTDIAIRTAKPREKPHKIADMLGLFVLVQPSGNKLWRMKYRFMSPTLPMSRRKCWLRWASRRRHSDILAGAILVAEDLLPSQFAALHADRRLAGVCLARGGPTSHVATLANAVG